MCGIAGFIGHDIKIPMAESLRRMTDSIYHRGPDSEGSWVDQDCGVALGHRRLSILDLSPQGHQPMLSASGRFVIVFNGEIYNFREVREELDKLPFSGSPDRKKWRGHSDTEVMLAAFETWGVEPAVKKFVGMFAFALWDRRERKLYLVRDRAGEKPLYYGTMGSSFIFGSELKALRAHPSWQGEIDRNSLALFLRHNYIPAPYSIYKGIRKLLPGTILELDLNQLKDANAREPVPYWEARIVAELGTGDPFKFSEAEAVKSLEGLLLDAVGKQMVADVPLGAFLSGGVDSSVIVALMQAQSRRPVKTFTIGFHEKRYNEAEHAKAVARHLGTEHTEFYVTPNEAISVIPKLPGIYDEPFADSSQVPTFLVSALTRKHVTVSLSGDAGDELFAGYTRYFLGRKIWNQVRRVPASCRGALAKAACFLSPQAWNSIYNKVAFILPEKNRDMLFGDRIHKLAEILAADSPEKLYHGLISHWKEPASIIPGASEWPTALTDRSQWANLNELIERMMYLDMVTYLPDDILVKVDRASMSVSLESRAPLLDHRVIEFAWKVPLSMKVRDGQGKWLLRQVLYKYVPRELIERPKTGFAVPIAAWLRGPLRDWAEPLLDERRLKAEGFFNPGPICQRWKEHISGQRNWHYYLWDVLMFQAWLEEERGQARRLNHERGSAFSSDLNQRKKE